MPLDFPLCYPVLMVRIILIVHASWSESFFLSVKVFFFIIVCNIGKIMSIKCYFKKFHMCDSFHSQTCQFLQTLRNNLQDRPLKNNFRLIYHCHVHPQFSQLDFFDLHLGMELLKTVPTCNLWGLFSSSNVLQSHVQDHSRWMCLVLNCRHSLTMNKFKLHSLLSNHILEQYRSLGYAST